MTRIATTFAALRAQNRGALIPFLEAYDPDRATCLAILHALPAAGADLIELGIPFTDPMADGPTIQRAALRALSAGATLPGVLSLVAEFRATNQTTPIILMGYLNPIEQYGPARFCADAAQAGVDGLIIVDLPRGGRPADPHTTAHAIDLIRLIAPTTTPARLPIVLAGSSGFVYYISITGITGTAAATQSNLAAAIPALRRATALPIAIGFGIRTPADAAAATRLADAAVVGSALIDTLAATLTPAGAPTHATAPAVLDRIRALSAAIQSARTTQPPA